MELVTSAQVFFNWLQSNQAMHSGVIWALAWFSSNVIPSLCQKLTVCSSYRYRWRTPCWASVFPIV